MNRLFFILPVILLAGIIAVFGVGLTRDPSILPSQLIDQPLPAFARPGIRPGDPGLASTELRGQPKLLNVFASWCIACKVEHPMLMRLKAEGVPLYGLSWKDKPEASARMLAESGDPYLRIASDASGRVGIDLGVTGAPETFVIDAEGRVRYRHVGPITPKVWEETLGPMMETLRPRT